MAFSTALAALCSVEALFVFLPKIFGLNLRPSAVIFCRSKHLRDDCKLSFSFPPWTAVRNFPSRVFAAPRNKKTTNKGEDENRKAQQSTKNVKKTQGGDSFHSAKKQKAKRNRVGSSIGAESKRMGYTELDTLLPGSMKVDRQKVSEKKQQINSNEEGSLYDELSLEKPSLISGEVADESISENALILGQSENALSKGAAEDTKEFDGLSTEEKFRQVGDRIELKKQKPNDWKWVFSLPVEKATLLESELTSLKKRPLLKVKKTRNHVYATIANGGEVLCSVCTRSSVPLRSLLPLVQPRKSAFPRVDGDSVYAAWEVGKLIGRIALEKGLKGVQFDRRKKMFTGKILAVVEGARAVGLQV